ncbi:MAG: phosphatase domain-containing protein [Gemmatimonadaceae bacterium]
MRDWLGELDSLVNELDKGVKGVARAVRSAFDDGPFQILAYRGYGNARVAHIHGRAQENRGADKSGDKDSTLQNLMNTYRRADSNPLEHAQLVVEYRQTSCAVKADGEGFFTTRIDLPFPVTTSTEWNEYRVDLIEPARPGVDRAKCMGEILVPAKSARFGVISDIDDTVIQSRVSNFLLAARTVMLGNARTRLPFPGVAAFYAALRNGATGDEKNPIFYVSSSPWNLYDVISEFMELQKIPRGPILLRDWDISLGSLASTRHFDHKGVAIRNIMRTYPELPFILIGDTSQHDPEIYRQIVSEFPNRVKAIYIRDVTHDEERSTAVKKLAEELLAAQSTLVLSEDTLGAATHAAEQGWISRDALPSVHAEKRADTGQDESKVAAPDGGEPGTGAGPTVIS